MLESEINLRFRDSAQDQFLPQFQDSNRSARMLVILDDIPGDDGIIEHLQPDQVLNNRENIRLSIMTLLQFPFQFSDSQGASVQKTESLFTAVVRRKGSAFHGIESFQRLVLRSRI